MVTSDDIKKAVETLRKYDTTVVATCPRCKHEYRAYELPITNPAVTEEEIFWLQYNAHCGELGEE